MYDLSANISGLNCQRGKEAFPSQGCVLWVRQLAERSDFAGRTQYSSEAGGAGCTLGCSSSWKTSNLCGLKKRQDQQKKAIWDRVVLREEMSL